MSVFAEYMESRKMLPLYMEAASLISSDIHYAINWCESRAFKDRKLGYIYSAIAHELNKFSEMDYSSSAARVQAAIQAKKDADAAQSKNAAAAAAAEQARKAAAEEEERVKVAGGRRYQHAPAELIHMLQHIGGQLKGLHSARHLSQDYAAAIQLMIMDLNSAIRRSKLPTNPDERARAGEEALRKAQDRHAKSSKELIDKDAAGKHYNDLLKIVKILRDNDLPTAVSDAHAASAYDKLFGLIMKIHASGGSIRKALKHWYKNKEIGDEVATDEELWVMHALMNLKLLPEPGKHAHEPLDAIPPEEHEDAPEDDTPKTDDEDLMNAPEPENPAPKKKKGGGAVRRGNTLREQQQHSIRMQVLAGIRR